MFNKVRISKKPQLVGICVGSLSCAFIGFDVLSIFRFSFKIFSWFLLNCFAFAVLLLLFSACNHTFAIAYFMMYFGCCGFHCFALDVVVFVYVFMTMG